MFVEKLKEKDFKELLEKLIREKYHYEKVEEIDENFLENNELEEDVFYHQIPVCFQDIKNKKNNKIFFGYTFKGIKKIANDLVVSFDTISFDYVSWMHDYSISKCPRWFRINDFNFISLPVPLMDVKNQKPWYEYMYSKFGQKYLSALKSHLTNEKNAKIDKINNELEEKNTKLINEITK